MKRALLPLALLAAVASNAHAEPALWRLRGTTATIYLFGTMHILPRPADWLTGHVADAFHSSQTLWEEADVGAADPGAADGLMRKGIDPNGDLWAKLPPDTATRFKDILKRCHIPVEAVAHFRPWLATIMPTICDLMAQSTFTTTQAGHPPSPTPLAHRDNSPEATLTHEAQITGKQVRYFETADDQIGFLANAPEQAQLIQLRKAIDGAATGADDFAALEDEWLRGDVAAIAGQVAKMRAEGEDFYRTILADRNVRFAARIKTLAASPGTHFIAIGAGHLAGPDSVQEALKKLGVSSERLN